MSGGSDNPFANCYPHDRITMRSGKGCYARDENGNRYLDFSSGIAVNALGYGVRSLAKIATKQLKQLTHCSNLFTTKPAIDAAEAMLSYQPFADRIFSAAFFSNSGLEANEAALKFAAIYSKTIRSSVPKFVSFTGSFHGRSLLTLSLTAEKKYKTMYGGMFPNTIHLPYNRAHTLHRALDDSVSAVIIEVIQGEGGMRTLHPECAALLNRKCRDNNILIIADEIQSAYGRSGRFYASEWVGLRPDIITLSKPIAGGLPLGATLITKKIDDCLVPGAHGSTFGGGPVQCAIAHEMWKRINNTHFLHEVRKKSDYFTECLERMRARFPAILEVRGMGLLRGLLLKSDVPVQQIIDAGIKKGLLLLRSGQNVLRLAPPLIIQKSEMTVGLNIIARCFDELDK